MELYFNECSMHGQFPDVPAFNEAIGRLFLLREVAARFGRAIYCHRGCLSGKVTHSCLLQELIGQLDRDKRLALLAWFTKSGPYWDDERIHSADGYIESQGEVVTDSAVGEAAILQHNGNPVQLASLEPSNWEGPEVAVEILEDDSSIFQVRLANHIRVDTLEPQLISADPPISSWEVLSAQSKQRFPHLEFSEESFSYLKGTPFNPGVADNIRRRLAILDQLKEEFDVNGARTDKGNSIYQNYFTGDKAWFSDSSASEKRDFKDEMTFKHPNQPGKTIFAPLHGKVKTPQIRIHFDWDFSCDGPIYVLYVGPKITKR